MLVLNRGTYARLGGHPPVLKALLRTFAPITCQVTTGEALLKKQWLPVTVPVTVGETRCTIAKTTGTSKAGRCLATLVHREKFTGKFGGDGTKPVMAVMHSSQCFGQDLKIKDEDEPVSQQRDE